MSEMTIGRLEPFSDEYLSGLNRGYSRAIDDVLDLINTKALTTYTPKGIPVVYTETLINLIKSLKKEET
jgi:hypothetical protein